MNRNDTSTLFTILFSLVLVIVSCRKSESFINSDLRSLNIDSVFDWATSTQIPVTISAKDNLDNPIQGVRFTLYTANPDSGGAYLISGITGINGNWNSTVSLPACVNTIVVSNDFLGLVRQMEIPVLSSGITGQFGGMTTAPEIKKSLSSAEKVFKSLNAVKWSYMSSYNNQGVPNNLMPSNDPVSQQLLHDINTALPEYKNEVSAHPEYFSPNVPNNINILALSDVYVTYITEGAGWMNSIGYFKFNTNQPPTSASQIDTIHIMFPNLSNAGSGGGLNPGNKIYLGKFPAGKSIGFVVVPHGWNGLGTYVGPTSDVWYSIPSFNTTDPLMTKHLLLFNDPSRQQILFSFEDQGKYQNSDQDCNDGIMYVTVNPIEAANTVNMPLLATSVSDQDHDGVPDNLDDYPTDPSKAFNNYTPSKSGYSSLAYEDLWPSQGDYDFNDLVISYRFNMITNAQNQVSEIHARIMTDAIGASFHSGFGFQLPFSPDKVSNVTGFVLKHGYINLSANKTESGQAKAVIIAFDDAFDQLHAPGNGYSGANTLPGEPFSIPDTLDLVITLSSPVATAQAGSPPFNPFIIIDGNRNREIHLPNQSPTDKVDGTEFGTGSDKSNPSQGIYYKTKNNLPWAMNIVEKFNYPVEKAPINSGFLKFNNWAGSSGTQYNDWYKDLVGYRQQSIIYSH